MPYSLITHKLSKCNLIYSILQGSYEGTEESVTSESEDDNENKPDQSQLSQSILKGNKPIPLENKDNNCNNKVVLNTTEEELSTKVSCLPCPQNNRFDIVSQDNNEVDNNNERLSYFKNENVVKRGNKPKIIELNPEEESQFETSVGIDKPHTQKEPEGSKLNSLVLNENELDIHSTISTDNEHIIGPNNDRNNESGAGGNFLQVVDYNKPKLVQEIDSDDEIDSSDGVVESIFINQSKIVRELEIKCVETKSAKKELCKEVKNDAYVEEENKIKTKQLISEINDDKTLEASEPEEIIETIDNEKIPSEPNITSSKDVLTDQVLRSLVTSLNSDEKKENIEKESLGSNKRKSIDREENESKPVKMIKVLSNDDLPVPNENQSLKTVETLNNNLTNKANESNCCETNNKKYIRSVILKETPAESTGVMHNGPKSGRESDESSPIIDLSAWQTLVYGDSFIPKSESESDEESSKSDFADLVNFKELYKENLIKMNKPSNIFTSLPDLSSSLAQDISEPVFVQSCSMPDILDSIDFHHCLHFRSEEKENERRSTIKTDIIQEIRGNKLIKPKEDTDEDATNELSIEQDAIKEVNTTRNVLNREDTDEDASNDFSLDPIAVEKAGDENESKEDDSNEEASNNLSLEQIITKEHYNGDENEGCRTDINNESIENEQENVPQVTRFINQSLELQIATASLAVTENGS